VQFTRIVLGWLTAGLIFLAADLLRSRLTGARASAPRWVPFAEALPFTLLLALWFASLGRGMWPLVLVLLALAIEAPGRLGEIAKGEQRGRVAKRVVPTLGKLLVTGAVLRVIL
jgi:hypothetical protein